MKRMSPSERKQRAAITIKEMVDHWTCRFGAWNRDKIMDEVEKQLKARRRAAKES